MSDWRLAVLPQQHERCTLKQVRGCMMITFEDETDDPCYVDPRAQAEWDELHAESEDYLKDVAAMAIDTMPDVSCAAIAEALGLKLHTVIGMSNGRHNKAKRRGVSKGIELAEVTRGELIENYNQQKGY